MAIFLRHFVQIEMEFVWKRSQKLSKRNHVLKLWDLRWSRVCENSTPSPPQPAVVGQ